MVKLGSLVIPVEERAGTRKYTLMSVTSGVGLVPQVEKFGREIAGNAYKNYYVIKKGDFAYNKSATKMFPEGYISMLKGYDEAAIPNSIFTCFRIIDKGCDPRFFDHLFHNNYHGAWLRNYIEVGSRAHGSLNVKLQHLWDMPVALPSFDEQRKIADCLSSLNELISAEAQKLTLLQAHKKGLLQKIFPAEGQTLPKVRFKGNMNSWKQRKLGEIYNICSGQTPFRGDMDNFLNPTTAWIKTTDLNNSLIIENEEDVSDKAIKKLQLLPVGTVLIAMYGGFNQIGRTGVLTYPATINQAISALPPTDDVDPYFLMTELNHRVEEWKIVAASSRKDSNITKKDVENFLLKYPKLSEQIAISTLFRNFDEYIAKQTQKVEALKTHKKGLMQGLFPTIEEVTG